MSTAAVRRLAALALAAGLAACHQAPRVEFITSPAMASLGLPFSEVVRVGDLLFLSGQVGLVAGELALVPGGIEAETRQVLENVQATLALCGADLGDVVKCTVFLADIAEWPRFNAVYAGYFGDDPPARSAVAGSGLALGARVELEVIAVAP